MMTDLRLENLPGKLKPAPEIKTTLDNNIEQLANELTSASKAPDKEKRAIELLESTRDLIANAQDALTKSPDSAQQQHLNEFIEQVRHWRFVVISLTAGTAVDNARTRFTDAGAWAMHFSVIRMTVSTFFIATAWGVVSLRWDDFSFSLAIAALSVWCLGGYFLFTFSKAEIEKCEKQKKFQNELPTYGDQPKGAQLHPDRKKDIMRPFCIYLFFTLGFLALLVFWYCGSREPSVKWMAIANKASMDSHAPKTSIVSVAWEGKLDAIANSIKALRTSPGGVMPIIDLTEVNQNTAEMAKSLPDIAANLKKCHSSATPGTTPSSSTAPATPFNEGTSGIQKALVLVGENPGSVDGKVGTKTRGAARSFCRTHGCSGYDDPNFVPKLQKVVNDQCDRNR